MRRWLAGLLSALADALYPPYPERIRRAAGGEIKPRKPDDSVLVWMESRGWNN